MAVFISNLAKKTQLMRSLLKHNAHFIWTSDMQKKFDVVKTAIANAVQLIHYDPQKPIIIETDASLKGLGAMLIQDSKPARFLSKALTAAEVNYANIERELLAVLFACEKLHNYTFGRAVIVHTDHQPLVSIFQKPVSLAPTRLQRMNHFQRLNEVKELKICFFAQRANTRKQASSSDALAPTVLNRAGARYLHDT